MNDMLHASASPTVTLSGWSKRRMSSSQYLQNMDFMYSPNAGRRRSRTSSSSYIDLIKVYFWLPSLMTSDRFQRKQLGI